MELYLYLGLLGAACLAVGGLLLVGGSVLLRARRVWKLARSWRRKVVTEEQRAEAARHKGWLEDLEEHAGWKLLMEVSAIQQQNIKNQVLYRVTENAMEQEYLKGQLAGVEIFAKMPATLLENAKAVLHAARNEEEGD